MRIIAAAMQGPTPVRAVATLARALGLCVCACRPSDPPPPRPHDPPPRIAPGAPSGRPLEALAPRASRWTITARESQSHGLSPLGFSLDESPPSMIATRFPAQGTLALFSGPPGGPLGAIVEVDSLSGADPLTLRDALRASPTVRIGSPRELGSPALVSLGGVTRPAVPMLTGTASARTLYCVVIVAPPEGVSRGLLVWLYISGLGVTVPECRAVLSQPSIASLSGGFRVEGL